MSSHRVPTCPLQQSCAGHPGYLGSLGHPSLSCVYWWLVSFVYLSICSFLGSIKPQIGIEQSQCVRQQLRSLRGVHMDRREANGHENMI
jgi:hypothetical protein